MRVILAAVLACAAVGCGNEQAPTDAGDGLVCLPVDGAVDQVRYDPGESRLILSVAQAGGSVDVLALDPDLRTTTRLAAGQDIAPGGLAVDKDGRVLLKLTGDNRIWDAEALAPVAEPSIEGWTSLGASQDGLVLAGFDAAGSYVSSFDPATGVSQELFRTGERLDGVWASPSGRSIVVSHGPFPEDNFSGGSSLAIIGEEPFSRRLPDLVGAVSASLASDGSILFVDPDQVRLGRLHPGTGELQWVRQDVDLVEGMPANVAATVNRGESAQTDTVCVGTL